MFATYSLNIRRLFTQSIRRRPNLHMKSEHRRIIAEYWLAVCENCSRQCIFFRKGSQLCTGLDQQNFQRKIEKNSCPSSLTYVLGAQQNCLIETVLLSTHNICFG